jgi:hypothetical protein
MHISDFTATAGTDLTAITPPIGSAWVLGSDGTTEVMLTNGSAIYRTTGGPINTFYIPDVADSDDFDVSFCFDILTQVDNWLRILIDVNTAGNTFYMITWQYDTDNLWSCFRRSVGSDTTLTGTHSASYSNGTSLAGRLTRRTESGQTKIRLYLNGSLAITWTDNSPLTATRRAGYVTDASMTSTTGIQLSGMALMNPGEASFTISPTSVSAGSSGNTLSLSGTNTPWEAIRAGFSVSGGSITGTTYNANDEVDLTYTAPGSGGTITVTCLATGATQTFTVTGGSLTAGTLSKSVLTNVGATLSWTAPSGGTSPITAQLKRKTGAGGTYATISGATSSPYTDTTASPDTEYYYKVVYTDAISGTADSNEVLVHTAHAAGFGDLLVTDAYHGTFSGLTHSILRPVKSSANPIWPNGGQVGTWDYDIYYPSIWRAGVNDYRMLAVVADSAGKVSMCYYTSPDGRTWTRPNLGLYSYGGTTNNNIVVIDPTLDPTPLDVYDGSPEGRTYVTAMAVVAGMTGGGIMVLCSEDAIHWTEGKIVYQYPASGGTATDFQESKGQCLLRSDGTYITFYSQGHFESPDLRQIGAYRSDTTDLRGDWTDLGILITGTGITDQRYDMQVIYQSVETWLAVVSNFNQTTDLLGPMRLYASHDEGLSWTLLDASWMPLGTGSDWESGQFGPGYLVWREGSEMIYGYTGTPDLHGATLPLEEKIGIATMGYRRSATIVPDTPATERSFTTDAMMTASTTYLMLNCNGSGGTVKVEVLDADDDSILIGYAKANFTAITRDVFEDIARWGGTVALPANQSIKLKFYLTDAALYSYQLTNTRPLAKPPLLPMIG